MGEERGVAFVLLDGVEGVGVEEVMLVGSAGRVVAGTFVGAAGRVAQGLADGAAGRAVRGAGGTAARGG
ncbi:hypothetical protein, partial [Catenulispora pinisilvae]|uniref:hypothetical protein n=1 Tax=Catenulispora pinisilvae TaxID=2705253 RepID=UPI001E4E9164